MVSTVAAPSKTLITGVERALLILPAVAGLALGLFPALLPKLFADISQMPADDIYAYQLAGAATLGYGVALTIGLFQNSWYALRLPVVGVLVFNLASLYACGIEIFKGRAPYSVYVVLASSILFVSISSFLLARHRGAPRLTQEMAGLPIRAFLIIGAVSSALFGLFPLFAPGLFTIFHLHNTAPFIFRQAGAASLGYAVLALLDLHSLNAQELRLTGVMAAVFNGVSGIVSIPFILSGQVLLLPWVIGPVGLLVLVACLLLIQQTMRPKAG